jgi:hypothetical protein
MTNLILGFNTQMGGLKTIRVPNARTDLANAAVIAGMNTIRTSNVCLTATGGLAASRFARLEEETRRAIAL